MDAKRSQNGRTVVAIAIFQCMLLHTGKSQDDRFSNLFLNAYINRHAHTEYLKMIEVYSPFGMFFYIVLTPISTTSGP